MTDTLAEPIMGLKSLEPESTVPIITHHERAGL
jgi:hypothetical protein